MKKRAEDLRGKTSNEYVYGGFSAAAMAICKRIEFYAYKHFISDCVQETYGVDSVMEGVDLVDFQIVPHADVPKWIDGTKSFIQRIEDAELKALPLNNEAVIVIDNNGQRVFGQ